MPRTPRGHKRPADVISNAVMVMKIATGEADEPAGSGRSAGGRVGGPARARALNPDERREIASLAARARWKKKD